LLATGRPAPWRAVRGGIELLDAARPGGVVDRIVAIRLHRPESRR
jgi:hypothetical protein